MSTRAALLLRLHFPLEFPRLKAAGCCEIEIPEWMFDMDYPGVGNILQRHGIAQRRSANKG